MTSQYANAVVAAKRQLVNIGLVLILALSLIAGVPLPLFADSATWIDGAYPVLAVGQRATPTTHADCFPDTFTYHSYTKPNGSPDSVGRDIDISICATQNQLGFYGGSGDTDNYDYVRPNTAHAFQVFNSLGNSLSVTPIPDQAVFFTKDSSQSFHGEVAPHFYDSFAGAGTFGPTNQQLALTINKPGTILTDSTGKKIYMHAYATSHNGEWMVIEAVSVGFLRVNTVTRQMQLFSTQTFSYSLGFTPQVTFAISDDGNTVIQSGKNASDTAVYDLTNCQLGAFTIGGNNAAAVQGCRKRSLFTSLAGQLQNFQFLTNMQFNGDGQSLNAIAAVTNPSGGQLYYSVDYSVAGYVESHVDYLALGDSFSSGEGAYDYVLGTNEPENTCHLSKNSYPYLAAKALGLSSFHSVACSGARSTDFSTAEFPSGLIKDPLRNELGDWQPGQKGQKEYLNMAPRSSVITISMIGNDVGFGDILGGCLLSPDSCYHFKEDRQNLAQSIQDKFGTLIKLYNDIQSDAGDPNAKVYVLGYPQIVGDGPTCDANTPFNQEERQMARNLTVYLNSVIEAATKVAGVQYIDVTDAFEGHENCQPGVKAVNALSIDRDTAINGITHIADVTHSSFHPNALGHQLLAEQLLQQSENFTKQMPTPDLTISSSFIGTPQYTAFIGNAPSGSSLAHIVYTGSAVVRTILKSEQLALPDAITGYLLPNAPYSVYFHSTPTFAGTLTTDANGNLQGQITVPDSIEPGFHTIHILGKDVSGQDIDMYQTAYVGASEDDMNGNGISDSQEQCVLVPDSGVDQDKDGIDDACDPEITEAPTDTTPPTITGVADREPDHNGWYNHDATINWTVSDPEPSSGIVNYPAPTPIDQEGNYEYQTGGICDVANNCSSGTFVAQLDKTPPDISFDVTPAPNGTGWNNGPVTVTFYCNDEVSGIDTCSDPVTVTNDGVTVVTGTATDSAGNSSSVNAIVSVDSTKPKVSATVSPASNDEGWNNTDVTITPECSDGLSGVSVCSEPQILTSEGVNQIVVSNAIDTAGNVASTVMTVNIDKTAPTVDSLTWSNNPKTAIGSAMMYVHASDNLSGAHNAEYFLGDTDPGAGHGATIPANGDSFAVSFGTDFPTGVYKVNVRVEDAAGNWSGVKSDYLVVYDPFSIRMTGKKAIVPSIAAGDYLPGLTDLAQTNLATFAFSVGYDKLGRALPNDLQFSYPTGTDCLKPNKAQNCHSFSLNAASVSWFTTQGVNSSLGTFAGSATMTIDGVSQQVSYILTGLDGERFSATSLDHLTLKVFSLGDSPAIATPIYQVSEDVLRGNIHIKT